MKHFTLLAASVMLASSMSAVTLTDAQSIGLDNKPLSLSPLNGISLVEATRTSGPAKVIAREALAEPIITEAPSRRKAG